MQINANIIKKIDYFTIYVIRLLYMISSTVNLNSETESLNDIAIESSFKGFILSYSGSEYIISVHHGKPIKEISHPIIINSVWNELLILEKKTQDESLIIKNIKLSIPKTTEKLNLSFNKATKIKLSVSGYKFLNLNNLPTNPRCMYIIAQMEENKNLQSLSGSPVFNNDNKLIGVFCKQLNNEIYILPSYYIIKTLIKKDNNSIYGVNFEDSIKKINNFNISNNSIYHKSLNTYIPVDAYFMLEGDIGKELLINNEHVHRFVDIHNSLPITNERTIVKDGSKYVVNAALLILLQMINKRIIINLIDFVKNNIGKKMYVVINEPILDNENNLTKKIVFGKEQYNITIYSE